jgi:hypothetical protein
MASRDVADGIGHGQHCESKGKSDTGKADTKLWEGSGKDRATTASENQPEGAEKLGGGTFVHRNHVELPVFLKFDEVLVEPWPKDGRRAAKNCGQTHPKLEAQDGRMLPRFCDTELGICSNG